MTREILVLLHEDERGTGFRKASPNQHSSVDSAEGILVLILF